MLSISPIRYDRPAKPTPVYPTQQLIMPKGDANDDLVSREELLSTPVNDGASILSPLTYTGAHIRNLSNQFIGEETPAEYAFENPSFRPALTPNSRLHTVDDETAIDDRFRFEKTPDPNYYDTFPIDLSKSLGGLCADVESTPTDHEHIALDTNIVNYYNADSNFPIRTNQPDKNAIDESTLDDFSLSSNGSFDLEAFSSAEIEQVVPSDPKGIYAMKSMKMKVKNKSKKSKGIKSSKTKSKALSTEVFEPTDLDILRGRGGLTNRHPGNMKFRDEARKLRSEYRHCDTSRQEKFVLSQVRK
jgi:hypothetical protein